jgi:LysM repeat protein
MRQFNRKLLNQVLIAVLAVTTLGFSIPNQALATTNNATDVSAYTCKYYTIRRGDTLTKISNLYGVTIRTLMQVNGLKTTRIYTGRRLCIPVTVVKPAPAPAPSAGGPWYGQYWNNTAQSGTPSLVRNDAAVDFNWGFGTPDTARVFADNFSARWTRTLSFLGGTYRFNLSADDGVRVWVDGSNVFDRYTYVGGQTYQFDVGITPGNHTITVDYVEQSGLAYVRATFYRIGSGAPAPSQPLPCAAAICPGPVSNGPWSAQFFNNINLDGAPVFTANYRGVQFNWGYGSPSAYVPVDNFGARFTQYRYFPAGVYRFVARSDDGVRIYVDNNLVINQWVQQSARTVTGDIALGDGSHLVRIEYFDLSALAELEVRWEFLGNPNQ